MAATVRREAGFFCKVYRADNQVITDNGNTMLMSKQGPKSTTCEVEKGEDGKRRDLYTTIYYLMEKTNAPCVNKSDIIHFFHDGCPVKYCWINMDTGELKEAVVGKDPSQRQCLHLMVPRDTLKWAVVLDNGVDDRCSLISECTVPGFCFEDRTMFSKEDLKTRFPQHWDKIQEGFS
eukprot:Seg2919.1 transcript_id=Seg2919.1/GoldUCD/mRNA.D3Y31 product="putative protein" protein_id=Seg2919.1/GoldUCD/D3Y31